MIIYWTNHQPYNIIESLTISHIFQWKMRFLAMSLDVCPHSALMSWMTSLGHLSECWRTDDRPGKHLHINQLRLAQELIGHFLQKAHQRQSNRLAITVRVIMFVFSTGTSETWTSPRGQEARWGEVDEHLQTDWPYFVVKFISVVSLRLCLWKLKTLSGLVVILWRADTGG